MGATCGPLRRLTPATMYGDHGWHEEDSTDPHRAGVARLPSRDRIAKGRAGRRSERLGDSSKPVIRGVRREAPFKVPGTWGLMFCSLVSPAPT